MIVITGASGQLGRLVVQALIRNGYTDVDFAALIELQAKASGLALESEAAPVSDGLERAA